jgi:hypothetical protein
MNIALLLTWVGTGCWGVCFWWMHRLSRRQESMLNELHEMTQRIEQLSKAEHELIKDIHPAVEEVKTHVASVAEAVTEQNAAK